MRVGYIKITGLFIFLLAAISMFSCSVLYAEGLPGFFSQDTGAYTTEYKLDEEEYHHDVDTYFRYIPSRRVDVQSGKVAIIDQGLEYSYEFKAFGKLPIKLGIEEQYIGINNSTVVKLPAHLSRLGFDMETTLPFFFENTYVRFGATPSFHSDNWNADAESFRIPMRAFGIYKPNDTWTFILGIAAYPRYEYPVLPIVGVIYKPNEKLTFNLIPDRPNISYKLNDKFTTFVEAGASFDEFNVTQNNRDNVTLQYREFHVGTGLRYKLNKYIQGSFTVGGIFNRYLEYRDSLGKVDIDSGFYSEARIEIKI